MSEHSATFRFDNSYFRELEGFYAPWQGAAAPEPKVLRLNIELAEELGLDAQMLASAEGAAYLSGARNPEGGNPLAMAYAGHQFGGYSPQLGDGRALLVGEIIDRQQQRRDLHLKGSGRTPFSRGGDGKAALGPVLREYLLGEGMYALRVPTTRALAAVNTGEDIVRSGYEPGAVLARVASSHLRVGTFQYFAASHDTAKIQQLADYAIARHYPELLEADNRYMGLFCAVRDAQAALVAQWVSVGFVHGVMNTDNMTISGETIDYGPCAFIDNYDPKAVFSSIDRQGRYAYGNQANIAQWNLARFAETLIHLINPENPENAVELATQAIKDYPEIYQAQWLKLLRNKLGLFTEQAADLTLINNLHSLMEAQAVDFTQLFRSMSQVVQGDTSATRALFKQPAEIDTWLNAYQSRCEQEDIPAAQRAAAMDRVNPVYIPRNHLVEAALTQALSNDMSAFDKLLQAVSRPFEEQAGFEDYALPAPSSFGPYTTYCGT